MELFNLIYSAYKTSRYETMSQDKLNSDTTLKVTSTILLDLAALLLTVMNIINKYWFMAITTSVLFVGLIICALLFGVFKKRILASSIMAVLIAFLFSIYAIQGQNDGFAILWILIVPPIGMTLVGIRLGTLLSCYFQLFLIAIFYTPLNQFVSDVYSRTFEIRFPILYLTLFLSAMLLSAQKEYYYQKTENMSYIDILTGLYNRRYYEVIKRRTIQKNLLKKTTIISLDINFLKYANDNFGHEMGDQMLIAAGVVMKKAFPDAELIARTGGDEYIIISYQDSKRIEEEVANLEKISDEYSNEYINKVSISVGYCHNEENPDLDITQMEKIADQRMYEMKKKIHELEKNKGLER